MRSITIVTLHLICPQDEFDDVAASYPSLLALSVRHSLVNPYYRLIWTGPAHMADTLSK